MASKKSTPLKATSTTRRASKLAKKRTPNDRATELLTEQRALHRSMQHIDEQKGRQDKRHNQHLEDLRAALWHRSAIACDEFSFAKVKTAETAAFAIVVAFSTLVTLDTITDADFRERRRQRGQRVLHQALDFLKAKNAGMTEWAELFGTYMSPWSDPNHQLRIGRQY